MSHSVLSSGPVLSAEAGAEAGAGVEAGAEAFSMSHWSLKDFL